MCPSGAGASRTVSCPVYSERAFEFTFNKDFQLFSYNDTIVTLTIIRLLDQQSLSELLI